jgi:hypothetical protein
MLNACVLRQLRGKTSKESRNSEEVRLELLRKG